VLYLLFIDKKTTDVVFFSVYGGLSIVGAIIFFFFGTTEVVNKYFFGLGPNEKLK
jgi:hypothetical protein